MSAQTDRNTKGLKQGMAHEGTPVSEQLLTEQEREYYVAALKEAEEIVRRANDGTCLTVMEIAVFDKIAANLYWIRSGEVELPERESGKEPEPAPEPETAAPKTETEPEHEPDYHEMLETFGIAGTKQELLKRGWKESRNPNVVWTDWEVDGEVERYFVNLKTGSSWIKAGARNAPASSEVEA